MDTSAYAVVSTGGTLGTAWYVHRIGDPLKGSIEDAVDGRAFAERVDAEAFCRELNRASLAERVRIGREKARGAIKGFRQYIGQGPGGTVWVAYRPENVEPMRKRLEAFRARGKR